MAVKISRPVVYALLLGVVGYGVLILTEPDAASKKSKAKTTKTAAAAPAGFASEDLTAHFSRYNSPRQNAFIPKLTTKKVSAALSAPVIAPPSSLGASTGTWQLTGINVIDGVRKALLENSASGELVFLKVGDVWSDQRVSAIEASAVILVNRQNQALRMGFVEPVQPTAASAGTTPVLLPNLPTPAPGGPPSIPSPSIPGGTQGTFRGNQ
jgi:hypothetical protein